MLGTCNVGVSEEFTKAHGTAFMSLNSIMYIFLHAFVYCQTVSSIAAVGLPKIMVIIIIILIKSVQPYVYIESRPIAYTVV